MKLYSFLALIIIYLLQGEGVRACPPEDFAKIGRSSRAFKARVEKREKEFIAKATQLAENPKNTASIQVHFTEFLNSTWEIVNSMSQEELAAQVEKNIEVMLQKKGYIRGLTPRSNSRTLDQLIMDFAMNTGDQDFGNIWGNIVSAPMNTWSFLEMGEMGIKLVMNDINEIPAEILEAAIWERTRRLLASGEWHVFRDPAVREAYGRVRQGANFSTMNALAARDRLQHLFPK